MNARTNTTVIQNTSGQYWEGTRWTSDLAKARRYDGLSLPRILSWGYASTLQSATLQPNGSYVSTKRVWGTLSGECYHVEGCCCLQGRSCNQIDQATTQRRPCKRCTPPGVVARVAKAPNTKRERSDIELANLAITRTAGRRVTRSGGIPAPWFLAMIGRS